MPASPTSPQMLQEELDASEAVYYQNILVMPSELTLFDPANLASYEKPQQGFYGEVFEDSSGNIIIAFEGTSSNLPGAISADELLAEDESPAALLDAVKFVQAVQTDLANSGLSSAPIYITGHSLGGAEAEAAAYDSSTGALGPIVGGVSFGAPGLPGYNNFYGTESPSNFTNYVDAGDPVGNYASDESSEFFTATAGSHFGNVTSVGFPDLVPVLLSSIDEYVIESSVKYISGLSLFNADLPTHELQNYARDLGKSLFDGTTVTSIQAQQNTNLDSTFDAQLAKEAASQSTPTPSDPFPVVDNPSTNSTPVTTNSLTELTDWFAATEANNAGGSHYIAQYDLFIVSGSGSLVVNGLPYSLGSTAKDISPAEFDAAWFEAGSTPGVTEIAVIAVDDLGNQSVAGDIAVSVTTPTTSPQPIVSTDHTPPTVVAPSQQLVTGIGSDPELTSTYLSVTDANSADYTPAQLTYTIVSAPSNGYLLKGGSVVSSFTQADVDNGLIEYQQNGTSVSSDSFTYYVSDPAGNRTANTAFNITIDALPTSTHPSLDTDSALSVGQGLTALITDSNLHVTDSGLSPWQIIYTVTDGPANGEIIADGSSVVHSFTQQQVDLGLISYKNSGDVSGSDNLTFTVADGAGGTIGQTAFDINVIPKDNLSVIVERPLSNDEEPDNPVIPGTNIPRAYSLVGSDVLSAVDPGIAPQNIVYTVESVPANALGFRVGSWSSGGVFTGTASVTTFTQAEVDAGEVFYAQPFGPTDTSGDQVSVVLSASDNAGNSVSNITLPVILYPDGLLSNGQFIAAGGALDTATLHMTASIGQATVIGAGLLNYLSPWFSSGQIEYSIYFAPSDGTLLLNGQPLGSNYPFNPNSTQVFTQQEIDDGDVSYVENGSVVTSDEFGLYVVDPSSPSNSPATIRVSVSTTGTAGGQVLTGSSGAETLSPGAGNNFLIGDGNSTASYADSPNGVTVNLANATVANGYGGTDTLTDIHSFVGASTGTNTVSYDGNRADYNIRQLGDGTLQVTDIRPGSPDGVDQYQSFQLFDFSNGTYNAVQLSSTTDDFKDAGISDILFRSDASGDTGFYAISNGVNVGWSDVGGSSTAYNIVGTGDFYSTGTTDILYRSNASGDTGFYQISNGANIGWHDIGASSTAYSVVGVGDFTGNGTDDVLYRDNAAGDTGFYQIVNGVLTGWVDIGASSTAYAVVGVGDFMGNGTDDILYRDNSTGDTGFYDIVNGVNAGWYDIGASSTAYSVVGVGDFMGDGTDDILYRDNTTGDTGFYDIVNSVNTGWHDIGASSTAYSVVATGDYLGNGISDVLFRDNTTGDTGFYAISNGVNIGWHDIGASSTAYHVKT